MTTVTLDPDQIRSFIGRSSRLGGIESSPRRRKHLEKIGRMVSDVDLSVGLGSGAFCRPEGTTYYIEVPEEISDQPVTNIDESAWGLLFQETILFHELGHVLWSDFDSLEAVKKEASAPEGIVQRIYNSAEDVAIESYLASRYNVRRDLRVMNENLVRRNRNQTDELGIWDAISNALLSRGLISNEWHEDVIAGDFPVDRGRDELVELEKSGRFDDFMKEFVEEKEGHNRAEMAKELADELWEIFGEDQDQDQSDGGEGGEGEDGAGQQQDGSPMSMDDHEESEGKQGDTPDDVDFDPDQDLEDIEDLEADAEEDHEREANRQESQENMGSDDGDDDPMTETLKRLATGNNLGEKVELPDWDMDESNRPDLNAARRRASSLAEIFRAKLQHERESGRRFGMREGKLESSDIARVATGNKQFRSREVEPEDKSYSVQIILDRSGSMSNPKKIDNRGNTERTNRRLKAAQRAAGQLLLGLNEVGIDASLMSMRNSDPHIEVPFGADPENHLDSVFSGELGGLTPLSDMMSLAREQVDEGEWDEQFILVVTDGEPDNEDQYFNELEECDIPVYGVYVDEREYKHGGHDKYFDRVRYATPDEVDKMCRDLCHSIIG